jgi:beta-lactamase regulating signal transducer with metallopeptidase domain/HEAT repeat protein
MISNFFSGMGALASGNVALLLMLLKATIILLAALGITLAMQRASAGARHLVWLVALGTVLFVPAVATYAPLQLRILPALVSVAPASSSPVDVPASPAAPASFLRSEDGSVTTISVPNVPATEESSSLAASLRAMSGISVVLAIWAAVVLGIVVSLAWAGLTVRRIVRQARPLDSPDWLTPLFEVSDRLGLQEAPRLLQSSDAKMPFACGLLQPTIVLPSEAEGWSLDRRHAVLLHELAHVRRRDLMGHTLGRLACALYWFHPLVWTAAKQLRNESERACDDLALACGTRATDYAEHLLDIVTSVRGDSTPLVALAMARRKEFEGRMLAILDPELRRSTPNRRQSMTLVASLALIAVVVGAASPAPREARAAMVSPSSKPIAKDNDVKQAGETNAISHIQSTNATASSAAASTILPKSEERPRALPAPIASVRAPNHPSSADAISALAVAGVNIGVSAAVTALQEVGLSLKTKGDKGSKNPDDRPILLAKVLRTDTSADLRRIAAWGLQEYADSPIAAEALANAIRKDADAKVREMAAWSAGQGNDNNSNATSALIAALKGDSNEGVRATAAWALGNIGDRSSVDGLASALTDASSDVRMRAAWAIGNISPKQAPKPIVAMLTDKEPRVRELAAWTLFQIQDPSTAPALESALRTEQNKDVQLSYIRALAAMGEKSVDALRGLLESSDPRIKSMAVRALAGGHAAGPWPWPWPEPRPFP